MIMEKIVFFFEQFLRTPEQQIITLVMLSCLCLLCVVIAVAQWVSLRRERIVLENSTYYQEVLSLNKRTKYHSKIVHDGKLSYVLWVNSKAKYDKTDELIALYEYLELYSGEINKCLGQVSENRRTYRAYISEFEALSSSVTLKKCKDLRIKYEKFREIEQELVDDEKLDMIQEVSITCFVKYTSPKGQNEYSKHCTFLESEIRTAMRDIIIRAQYTQSEEFRRKNERSKVTPSLRLQVIERDNRRCCICGRSVRDGVTLEVDHILPISRGGKTTYDNLQTLCRDCNRGKGDKLF